ncbi:MAG: hypothetical protein J2P27_09195, partial [Actinobacteria bacterium]|nr:hypothetical protein [Actinomycetota bacterium]
MSAAAVVAVVVIVGAHGTIGGPNSNEPGPAGMNLAAFVTKSAKTTLAKKTADINVRGTVEAGGAKVELHGNGQADFAKGAVALNVSVNAVGQKLTEREIITNQGLWLQLTMNGQSLGQIIGGKAWFEVPLTGQPVSNSLQESPISSLQLLEQQGARVIAMGAQNVGGLTCNEYTVTPTKQALIAAAQRQWAKLGLSSSDTAAARQLVENSTPPTITIWIDPKQDLTCQLAFYMQLGTGSSSGSGIAPPTESAQLLMTFTHYGVPVNITPPPKSDT